MLISSHFLPKCKKSIKKKNAHKQTNEKQRQITKSTPTIIKESKSMSKKYEAFFVVVVVVVVVAVVHSSKKKKEKKKKKNVLTGLFDTRWHASQISITIKYGSPEINTESPSVIGPAITSLSDTLTQPYVDQGSDWCLSFDLRLLSYDLSDMRSVVREQIFASYIATSCQHDDRFEAAFFFFFFFFFLYCSVPVRTHSHKTSEAEDAQAMRQHKRLDSLAPAGSLPFTSSGSVRASVRTRGCV